MCPSFRRARVPGTFGGSAVWDAFGRILAACGLWRRNSRSRWMFKWPAFLGLTVECRCAGSMCGDSSWVAVGPGDSGLPECSESASL